MRSKRQIGIRSRRRCICQLLSVEFSDFVRGRPSDREGCAPSAKLVSDRAGGASVSSSQLSSPTLFAGDLPTVKGALQAPNWYHIAQAAHLSAPLSEFCGRFADLVAG